jgi:hypothetical protein
MLPLPAINQRFRFMHGFGRVVIGLQEFLRSHG